MSSDLTTQPTADDVVAPAPATLPSADPGVPVDPTPDGPAGDGTHLGDGEAPDSGHPAPIDEPPARSGWTGRAHRLVRGRPSDPAWVRPALLTLLVGTAVLYLWGLGASGWANSFYSAAVQAGTKSFRAAFFGSSDASNFITVDKPPVSLWLMEIPARIFGVNAWSILVPQALEGVASVGVLYLTVRRWFSPAAGLLAGGVLALTPVAVLMFRFNNPDALLVLLLTLAAYCTVRGLESGRTRWIVLMAVFVGTGFLTKMLQAYLVIPAFGLVYLLAAPPRFWRRVWQLTLAAVALVVASGWWVAVVQLTPASDRPYIGGSQNNSVLDLVFGYNGFGRLSGNETGSVVAGGRFGVGGIGTGGGSLWGPTGWNRLFQSSMGGQISWLLPAALIFLVAALVYTARTPRTDRTRAAFLLWGGSLLTTAVVFSFAQGIIHPYYTVALAPAIGALVGMGAVMMWSRRASLIARLVLVAALAATVVWGWILLDRSPEWHPWLRPLIGVAGIVAGVALLLPARWLRRWVAIGVAAALVAILAGPTAYAVETAATPESGAIPTAGPAVAGGMFGFGLGGGAGRRFAGLGAGGAGGAGGARAGGFGRFRPGAGGGFAPGGGAGGTPGTFGGPPGGFGGGTRGQGRAGGLFGGRGTGGAGGIGGLLNGSTPGAALTKALSADAGRYRWVAATSGSDSASGYQLATRDPVMAIGGFNGTDPAPTLAEFQEYVRQGEIHYYIGGSGLAALAGFAAASSSTADDAQQIGTWVRSHFTATTIDGVTVYDLTRPSTSS